MSIFKNLSGLEAMAEDLSIGVSAHDHSHGVSSRQKESKFMQKSRFVFHLMLKTGNGKLNLL